MLNCLEKAKIFVIRDASNVDDIENNDHRKE